LGSANGLAWVKELRPSPIDPISKEIYDRPRKRTVLCFSPRKHGVTFLQIMKFKENKSNKILCMNIRSKENLIKQFELSKEEARRIIIINNETRGYRSLQFLKDYPQYDFPDEADYYSNKGTICKK